MRKMLWIAPALTALGCVAGLGYYLATWSDPPPRLTTVQGTEHVSRSTAGDIHDDSESSDVFEPLVVDGGTPTSAPRPQHSDEPVSRVVRTPDMKQAPRPDAEPELIRMPYADEVDIWRLVKDPVMRILETEPLTNLFEELEKDKSAEESEPQEPNPPAIDPHEMHCPYHGGCPAPYRYR